MFLESLSSIPSGDFCTFSEVPIKDFDTLLKYKTGYMTQDSPAMYSIVIEHKELIFLF